MKTIEQQIHAFLEAGKEDSRLTPSHISLYAALAYHWHTLHYEIPFTINRSGLMQLSKISGRTTYNKYIQELHEYGYIHYVPSYNPFLKSLVYLHGFPECVAIIQLKKDGL
jgi:hypothetical protein